MSELHLFRFLLWAVPFGLLVWLLIAVIFWHCSDGDDKT